MPQLQRDASETSQEKEQQMELQHLQRESVLAEGILFIRRSQDVRNFVQQANMVRGIAEEASAAECLPSDAKKNFSPCHKAELDDRIHPSSPTLANGNVFSPKARYRPVTKRTTLPIPST
ncbi:hypothetical protein R1flu_018543 [Riccia fluitans]|uniref:Uncharacterized protein n=1 Tax=Riccia fluitans TaxID=41844 RepID=A0ABD1ZG54_9MARC